MKRIHIINLILSGFIVLSSCENFLFEDPKSSISSENFYKTQSDVLVSINSIYSSIAGYYGQNVFNYGDISTEIANGGASLGGLYTMEYIPTDETFRGTWTTMYRTINYANLAINRIPGVQMDENIKERSIAEARFLRALSYFELVKCFGGVPKITEPTVDDSNNRLPRATVEEIYDFVIQDLEHAESVLKNNTDVGRATSGAAKAMLAKVYIQRGDWANTLKKTSEVIQSGLYVLCPNYKDVFEVTKKNGPEHIFSIQFKSGNAMGGGSGYTSYFGARNPNIMLNGMIGGEGCAARPTFYQSVPGHYRKEISMVAEFPSPHYPEITAVGVAQVGPTCMKYWDPSYGINIGGGDANWIVIRYADVLLMYAEAENEINGPTAEAYEKINAIRKRARDRNGNGIDEPDELAELPSLENLTKEEFRDAVAKERAWELCFEGHHRWDLLRTNQFLEKMRAIGYTPTEMHLLFPVPFLEIQANPNLTQNPQYY